EDEEVEEEADDEWDEVKNHDNIIGKSESDIDDLKKMKPRDVRNDKTGKWKVFTIAENTDLLDYALSYSEKYMEDDEIHFIVNFNYDTTTWLNNMNGLLYVDIREYVKKEE